MSGLTGKLVVVTGAATGVGRALACEVAARGARVIVVDVDDTSETVAIIGRSGGSAIGAACDVRDRAALGDLAEAVTAEHGSVNILCANAGVGSGGTIDSIGTDEFRAILEVNVVGVFNTVQAFLPALRAARAANDVAAVLITGSEHSLGVPPYVPPMTAYTTSKHALLGLAGAIRRDVEDDGIGVSILCPSYVRTERLRGFAATMPSMQETLDRYGQDADDVARRALDGVTAGRFAIPTNAVSREFVVELHTGLLDAMAALQIG